MLLDPGLNKEGPSSEEKAPFISFFLKNYYYFMEVAVSICTCECQYLLRPQEGIRSTGTGLLGFCESSDVGGCWESKVGPLDL